MSTNYNEDALIAAIDAQRAGLDPMWLDDQRYEERQRQKFMVWACLEHLAYAEMFSNESDSDLCLRLVTLEAELALAQSELGSFSSRSTLSRRGMRKLHNLDDESNLTGILKNLEERVAKAGRRYDEVLNCLNARDYLKGEPEIAQKLRELRKDSQAESVWDLERVAEPIEPDAPRPNGNGRHT